MLELVFKLSQAVQLGNVIGTQLFTATELEWLRAGLAIVGGKEMVCVVISDVIVSAKR